MINGKDDKYLLTLSSSILATDRTILLEVFLMSVSGWL